MRNPMSKKHIPAYILTACSIIGIIMWKTQWSDSLFLHKFETSSKKDLPPILYVGPHPINQHDIEFETKIVTSSSILEIKNSPIKSVEKEVLKTLLERKVLVGYIKTDSGFNSNSPSRREACSKQAANNEALAKTDKQRLKTFLCEKSLIDQYFKERILINISISDDEIKDYYKDHKSKMTSPMKVYIRQIVLADEAKANLILRQVNRSNFAFLAKKHSITPEGRNGGSLPPYSKKNSLPKIFNSAFLMQANQISSILKSTYGFHIIMLEKRAPQRSLSFKEAKPKIEQILAKRKKERAYKKWVDLALRTVSVNTAKGSTYTW